MTLAQRTALIYVTSLHKWALSWEPQTGWRRPNVLRDGLINCWFWSFFLGFAYKRKTIKYSRLFLILTNRLLSNSLYLFSRTIHSQYDPSVPNAARSSYLSVCFRGLEGLRQWSWDTGASMAPAQRSVISSWFSSHGFAHLALVTLTWADWQEENSQLSWRFASVRQTAAILLPYLVS